MSKSLSVVCYFIIFLDAYVCTSPCSNFIITTYCQESRFYHRKHSQNLCSTNSQISDSEMKRVIIMCCEIGKSSHSVQENYCKCNRAEPYVTDTLLSPGTFISEDDS